MIKRSAIFSPCRTYRYALWRPVLDPDPDWQELFPNQYVLFVGLNPSTADEIHDDQTIRRCIGYARAWGFGGLCMANLFAFRATDPKDMKRAADPIGPDNDLHLIQLAAGAGLVVAAWGTQGSYLDRNTTVMSLLPGLYCLRTTKDGHPAHPSRLPKDLLPTPWERSCRVCGCTEEDCSECVERTGRPCHWVAWDLCSACA